MLRMLVEKYGESEWRRVSREMPNRSTRQCRERWQNHLKVNPLKEKWSPEEDALLKIKYKELGPKWKSMEPFFPGRTSINIRNRFNCLRRFSALYSFSQDQKIDSVASSDANPNSSNVPNGANANSEETSSDGKNSISQSWADFIDPYEPMFDIYFNLDFSIKIYRIEIQN